MSAAFSKVHGVRLRMIGSHLGGKPVGLSYTGRVSPAGHCNIHPTGRQCAHQAAPLQVSDGHCFTTLSSRNPPKRCASYSRRPGLAARASQAPEPSCGGQGRPLLTAARQYIDGASPTQSSHCVVNFYHLTNIEHPYKVHREHLEWMLGKDIMGRIYISRQGINAQYSGPREDAVAYAEWVAQQEHFEGLYWTAEDVQGHQFPKLRLKVRENLVQLAGGTQQLPICDPEARATPLSPSQWQEMLRTAVQPATLRERCSQEATEGSAPGAVVLDVRNAYEWDAGHFVGAARPLEDSFNETPTEASGSEELPAHLQHVSPDTPVMMYCTGGIRCDIYSAYLRRKGFKNLYTLEKGVQNYMKQMDTELWEGSLFVFDGRMAIRPGNEDGSAPDKLPAATSCALCGGEPELPHLNCANIDCNKLFLACETCKAKQNGCCCEACISAPRLVRRPNGGGNYARWLECATEEMQDSGASETRAQRALRLQQAALARRIAEGRSDGRTRRRLLRKERLNERMRKEREEHTKRRQMVKEALARQEEEAEAAEADRLAQHLTERLRELRESRERRRQTMQV